VGLGAAALMLMPGVVPVSKEMSVGLALLCLSIAAFGMYGTLGPFWTLPNALLSGTAAAGGIALINSVGNLGGFAGPYMIGNLLQGAKDNYSGAIMVVCGAFLVVSFVASMVHVRKVPGEAFDNVV
jgi:ACS family tartrate transporter-like MFS transporter